MDTFAQITANFVFITFFSGNHDCVSVINNYVEKKDVYYYTKKQPFEENAKLPLAMAKPLHQLVMTVKIPNLELLGIIISFLYLTFLKEVGFFCLFTKTKMVIFICLHPLVFSKLTENTSLAKVSC